MRKRDDSIREMQQGCSSLKVWAWKKMWKGIGAIYPLSRWEFCTLATSCPWSTSKQWNETDPENQRIKPSLAIVESGNRRRNENRAKECEGIKILQYTHRSFNVPSSYSINLHVKEETYYIQFMISHTVEPLIAYTLIVYEGGASGRSRLVGGGFSL